MRKTSKKEKEKLKILSELEEVIKTAPFELVEEEDDLTEGNKSEQR